MKNVTRIFFAVLVFGSMAFAAMNGPTGLAVDASGNLYVSNFNANTVQVYNPAHKLIRTIRSAVNQPYGLAVDGLGFLHVANYGGGTVTRYDSTSKLAGTLLGLVNPIFLAVDGLSEVWVVDHTINTLSAWDFYGNQLYSFTATGNPNSVYYGVAEHAGLLVTLTDNSAANVFEQLTGDLLHFGASVGGGQPVAGTVTAVAFDTKNNEWVANSAGGVYLPANFGSFKQIITLSYNPAGIAVDELHKLVYFSHNINNNVDVYTTAGKFVTTIQ